MVGTFVLPMLAGSRREDDSNLYEFADNRKILPQQHLEELWYTCTLDSMHIRCFGDDDEDYSNLTSGYHTDSYSDFFTSPPSRYSFSTAVSTGPRLKRAVGKVRRQFDRVRSSLDGLTATVPPPFRCFSGDFIPCPPSSTSFVSESNSDSTSNFSSEHRHLRRALTKLRGSIERFVMKKDKFESRCSSLLRFSSLSPRVAMRAWQRQSSSMHRSHDEQEEEDN